MGAFKDWLRSQALLDGVLLSPSSDVLLAAFLTSDAEPPQPSANGFRGKAKPGLAAQPLFFDFSLDPGAPEFDFVLVRAPGGGFDLSFDLTPVLEAGRLTVAKDAAENALVAAVKKTEGDEEWLEEAAGPVRITGDALALRIEARPGAVSQMSFCMPADQPDGLLNLRTEPTTVLLGTSGFGLELPDGFFVDMTGDFAPSPATADGAPVPMPGDDPAWKGLSIRNGRFFLPESVTLFGRTAVEVSVDVGSDPPGIALSAEAHAPARDGRPKLSVRLECLNPQATGLASFVPTLVEVAAELPVDGHSETVGGAPVTVKASRPLIARARFARESNAASETTRVTVGVESRGGDGLVSFDAADGAGSKIAVAAGAFATALIAEKNLGGDCTPERLIAVGAGLSRVLKDQGRLVLHGAELSTEGASPKGLALTDRQTFSIDYSVDVVINPLDLQFLSVSLAPEQPLRIRMRGVALSLDHSKSGLGMVDLDFEHAVMEIEDPGRWLVDSPGLLFDVLGTRSGRGSMWVEVDLRFKLSLGPIKVSGATIRGVFDTETGKIGAEIRGLDVALSIPAVIEGQGKIEVAETGFAALLAIKVVPLGCKARGFVRIDRGMVILALEVDLPGPIPLANSGLGLFGVGGAFGSAARISEAPPGTDPIIFALRWEETQPDAFSPAPGNVTLGFKASVGTLADFGYAFSARAGLFLTVPEIVVRGSLDAHILSGPISVSDPPPSEDDEGIAFRGVVIVDPQTAVTFGLSGVLNFPPLIRATIPTGGNFPTTSANLDDWYFYVGADGAPMQGRGIGPATITVLPGILDERGDGYFMLRGRGLMLFPRGLGSVNVASGFVAAFGFGLEFHFGAKPFAWIEVDARADVLIATNPLTIAGYGRIDGSLHVGPVSIGVDAELKALITTRQWSIDATVCGKINLLFKTIRKCVHLEIGSDPSTEVPWPETLPIDLVRGREAVGDSAWLVDDAYRLLAPLARSPEEAQTVWPDALISLTFATPPTLPSGLSGGQFPSLDHYPEGSRARPIGSEMLSYDWALTDFALLDVTGDEHGPGAPVEGAFSSAWQTGRGGDPATSAEPAELVLFDVEGALFIDRMADAGIGLPHDPLGARGRMCQFRGDAKPGWLLGAMAAKSGWLWSLPPEFVSPDPTQSRVSGAFLPGVAPDVQVDSTPIPLDESGRRGLPPAYDQFASRLVDFETSVKVSGIDREFFGELRLDSAFRPNGVEPPPFRFRGEIYLDDPILTPAVLVLSLSFLRGEAKPDVVTVIDQDRRGWSGAAAPMSDGRTALVFKAPDGQKALRLRVSWPQELQVGLLGLMAVTQSAADAAAERSAAQQDAAATQAEAAERGPLTDAMTQTGATRCLLQPGRIYRLDVGLEWTGTLVTERRPGQKETKVLGPKADYRPEGPDAAAQAAARSYFFRTTPVPSPASDPVGSAPTALGYLNLIHKAQDVFAPKLLERHLAGYEPGQTETARFRKDGLRATFGVGHVAALADLYGFALKLGLRRTDAAGPAGNVAFLETAFLAAQNPSFLSEADQIRHAVATGVSVKGGVAEGIPKGPCPTPAPGLTLEGFADLDPRAWYELYVAAEATDGRSDGKLSGVTFQTSRWFGPADMVASLVAPPPGRPVGDLEIDRAAGFPRGSVLGDDGAFDDAMGHVGLAGWPLAEEPRSSVLWLKRADGSGWDCAGALIESPEPIHRPGRCELPAEPLAAMLSPLHPKISFDLAFRDRSGSRLLFLTSTPFRPASWPAFLAAAGRFGLKADDVARWAGRALDHAGLVPRGRLPIFRKPSLRLSLTDLSASTTLTGTIPLPSTPAFAGEAS